MRRREEEEGGATAAAGRCSREPGRPDAELLTRGGRQSDGAARRVSSGAPPVCLCGVFLPSAARSAAAAATARSPAAVMERGGGVPGRVPLRLSVASAPLGPHLPRPLAAGPQAVPDRPRRRLLGGIALLTLAGRLPQVKKCSCSRGGCRRVGCYLCGEWAHGDVPPLLLSWKGSWAPACRSRGRGRRMHCGLAQGRTNPAAVRETSRPAVCCPSDALQG